MLRSLPTCFTASFFLEPTDQSPKSASTTSLELSPCMLGQWRRAFSLFSVQPQQRKRWLNHQQDEKEKGRRMLSLLRTHRYRFQTFHAPLSREQSRKWLGMQSPRLLTVLHVFSTRRIKWSHRKDMLRWRMLFCLSFALRSTSKQSEKII